VITNQSGIARGYFTEETLSRIHDRMKSDLQQDGASIDAIYVCPHHPDDECECRKPKPALLLKAAREIGIALDRSYMVGDDPKDVQAGKDAGCRTVWLTADPAQQGHGSSPVSHHVAPDLFEAVEWLLKDA
jgi:histidinol-phosphate phosphatase family protein